MDIDPLEVTTANFQCAKKTFNSQMCLSNVVKTTFIIRRSHRSSLRKSIHEEYNQVDTEYKYNQVLHIQSREIVVSMRAREWSSWGRCARQGHPPERHFVIQSHSYSIIPMMNAALNSYLDTVATSLVSASNNSCSSGGLSGLQNFILILPRSRIVVGEESSPFRP